MRITFHWRAVAILAISAVPASAAEGLRVIAGDGTAGFRDGKGVEARFHKPIRLAPLGPESVVVADIFNHALRSVAKDGTVTTLAGAPDRKGHQDGAAAEARFASPHGVAVSAGGIIAVAEAENHTIRLMKPSGGSYLVSTLSGSPGKSGLQDGPAAGALFNSPHAVLWAKDGALYTPDIGNARLRRIRNGTVETVAGAESGTFVYPMDIAWGPGGALLVADAGSNLLRRFVEGRPVETVKLQGELHTPHGVCVGPDGTVYVADMKSHSVLAIDAEDRLARVAGTGSAGGGPQELNRPAAVLAHAGLLWVADLDNHRIVALPLR